MQCSETIADIATALALAQIELANPEKSALGRIVEPGGRDVTFRYASLASGLDVVRKALGNHKIAVTQTARRRPCPGVSQLMHTSGKWLSSDWPVCRLSDTAAPRRMGAALTCARRSLSSPWSASLVRTIWMPLSSASRRVRPQVLMSPALNDRTIENDRA